MSTSTDGKLYVDERGDMHTLLNEAYECRVSKRLLICDIAQDVVTLTIQEKGDKEDRVRCFLHKWSVAQFASLLSNATCDGISGDMERGNLGVQVTFAANIHIQLHKITIKNRGKDKCVYLSGLPCIGLIVVLMQAFGGMRE